MNYQPFLIAPFGTGLDTDVEPWLLPQDAFSSIVNGHVHRGVVEKREGFKKHGDVVHGDATNWVISSVTQADPAVVTVTSTTSELVNGDTVELRDVTGMTEVNNQQFVIANKTATTFELENVDSTSFSGAGTAGTVLKISQNDVMGLARYIDSSNVKEVLAFDTVRACKFDETNDQYVALDSADIMSGTDTDYVWTENWTSTASTAANPLNRLYFTNGKALSGGLDGIRYYDGGTTTTSFAETINGATVINGCKLIFAFRQRLVLLNTFEGPNNYPQRARWSQAQSPSLANAWDDNVAGRGGYVDAPTSDHIISAQFLQDILIVYFTDSVWTLRATADPALPFRWDKINDFRACDAKMSTEQFDRYVVSAGIRGITATDGVENRRFDERIEDFVTNAVNNGAFAKLFTKRSFASRRMWMLYPRIESDDADSALIYDEESGAFSTYDIDMNVLGFGGASTDQKLNDFEDQDLGAEGNRTIDSYFSDEGSEVLLGGNQSGVIYKMQDGGSDNELDFNASIVAITQADPGVVTMSGSVGLADGDRVRLANIVGMTELNDRDFIVAGKSGNEFQLEGEDTSGYTAYGSAGDVLSSPGNSIEFNLTSAAWNPWMSEGKQCQLGYVDLFLDTEFDTTLTAEFFANNDNDPYKSSTINLLPNLKEIANISNVSQANPGVVTAGSHGLSNSDTVYLYNVEGMESVNGLEFTITVVDENSFSIGVDTSNYAAYTTGGVVTLLPFESNKQWKRIYAGGTGYQHKMRLISNGENRDLRIHAFMPWFKPRSVRPI